MFGCASGCFFTNSLQKPSKFCTTLTMAQPDNIFMLHSLHSLISNNANHLIPPLIETPSTDLRSHISAERKRELTACTLSPRAGRVARFTASFAVDRRRVDCSDISTQCDRIYVYICCMYARTCFPLVATKLASCCTLTPVVEYGGLGLV